MPEHRLQHTEPFCFSFLKTWPTSRYTTLKDEEFVFACRLLAGVLEPKKYWCPIDNCDVGQLQSTEYTQHVFSCVHCGGMQFHIRHEKVNNVIHKILRYSGIVSILNPVGLPLPDRTKGGPDLLVNTDRIDAVDVAVTRTDEFSKNRLMKAVTNQKFRAYKNFEQLTSYNIVPFVMSVYGEHGVEAVQAAKYWARASSSSTTFTDLLTFSQMELIRGMHQGLSILHHRVQAEFLGKGNGGEERVGENNGEDRGTEIPAENEAENQDGPKENGQNDEMNGREILRMLDALAKERSYGGEKRGKC